MYMCVKPSTLNNLFPVGVPALLERGFNRSEYVSELRRWSYQLMPEYEDVAFEMADYEYTDWRNKEDLEANRKSFVDVSFIRNR